MCQQYLVLNCRSSTNTLTYVGKFHLRSDRVREIAWSEKRTSGTRKFHHSSYSKLKESSWNKKKQLILTHLNLSCRQRSKSEKYGFSMISPKWSMKSTFFAFGFLCSISDFSFSLCAQLFFFSCSSLPSISMKYIKLIFKKTKYKKYTQRWFFIELTCFPWFRLAIHFNNIFTKN